MQDVDWGRGKEKSEKLCPCGYLRETTDKIKKKDAREERRDKEEEEARDKRGKKIMVLAF